MSTWLGLVLLFVGAMLWILLVTVVEAWLQVRRAKREVRAFIQAFKAEHPFLEWDSAPDLKDIGVD